MKLVGFADTEQRERLNVRIREINTDVVSWSLGHGTERTFYLFIGLKML